MMTGFSYLCSHPSMTSLLLFPKLLIAGGASFLGTLEVPPATPIDNHTLAGEKIPAPLVVCRDQWGTPMLPNAKGGYSLIAPINRKLIAQSLWIPPVSGTRPVVEIPPPPAPPTSTDSSKPATASPSSAAPSAASPATKKP